MKNANRGIGSKRGSSSRETPSSSGDRPKRENHGDSTGSQDVHHRGPEEKGRSLPRVFGERRPQAHDRKVQLRSAKMHKGREVQSEVVGRTPATVHKIRSLANCEKCPFYRADNFRPVVPIIPKDPYGVLIGESPGREEEDQGIPFVGSTGEALNDELLDAGLLRSRLVLINAICCLPTAKNVSVMGKALQACRPVFLHYMHGVDPKLPVFAMGAWAMAAYVGRRKAIEKTRGFVRDVELSKELKDVDVEEEGDTE